MQENPYTSTLSDHGENISKSELRKRNTQTVIKSALFTLIEKQDFNSISVEDICKQANVVRKTFYNHFRDKRDVLQVLYLDITLAEAAKNTRAIMAEHESSADRITALFRAQQINIHRYGIARKKVIQAAMEYGTPTRKYHELKQDFDTALQALFRDGQLNGDVCQDFSPRFLANIVYSALSYTVTQWLENNHFDASENERLNCLYLLKVIQPQH